MSANKQGLREKRHGAVVPKQQLYIKVQTVLCSFTVTVYWSLFCYCTLPFTTPSTLEKFNNDILYKHRDWDGDVEKIWHPYVELLSLSTDLYLLRQ